MSRFVSPRPGLVGAWQNRLTNARGWARARRAVMGRLPFPVLASDVRDVLYATWLVPVEAARRFVPAGVELLEAEGRTPLTVLSYAHGAFGPALAGPLRRLFPSPLQSNWRFYVARLNGLAPDVPTVLFVRNVFDSALYALGTRLFSDALPSHLAARFEHRCGPDDCETRIVEGGSAPGLHLHAVRATEPALPAELTALFAGWRDAVAVLASQDAALAVVEEPGLLALARIALPIALDTVVPMRATEYRPGTLLAELQATGTPFCFFVPRVRFRVLSEQVIRTVDAQSPLATRRAAG